MDSIWVAHYKWYLTLKSSYQIGLPGWGHKCSRYLRIKARGAEGGNSKATDREEVHVLWVLDWA